MRQARRLFLAADLAEDSFNLTISPHVIPPALCVHLRRLCRSASLADVREALGGETVQRVAIYSAGCMLFMMLTDASLVWYCQGSPAQDDATEAAWVGLPAVGRN